MLKAKVFNSIRDLVEFVNKNNISKSNVLEIITKNEGIILLYYDGE